MAASIPSVNNFTCKTLSKSSPNLIKIASSSSPLYRIITSTFSVNIPIIKALKTKRDFTVRAVIEGGGRADNEAAVPGVQSPSTEIEVLKKQLLESFDGTNRGLSASSETRAEIVELITQLELQNPNPAPTQALTLLNGRWILAYTSFLGFYPLLSSEGAFPLVKVEEISQTIDSDNFTVQNSVLFSGPLATTSITTNAEFEVRSPKRVQIKFDEGIIGTPQLTDSIVLPENVEFLGQKIDLAPFKGLLTSIQDTASSVARTISSRPPLKFSIASSHAESWLLTTYLDHDLRVSRGDGGSIFVLIKDAISSPLLTTS
ncbi:Plastid-lipid associated protein PAP / fibrillin family protein [Perilla frutescens var. hirtella]|uniref:Plastid-lipid associated protein PAP / fibrillin family protein n=1 Tax=Perilla frutescens var. hirtella TaxID=608512 RepID=A0AAD4IYH7_PERFH|nr:Plastid-lipid associated protein PAP / fibrillin family protein [Perilla frutescens var. hirtella]